MPHYREEVLNIYLAELLRDRGIIGVPESIIKRGPSRKMPDVFVDFFGLRVMIEGKVDDTAKAHEKAFEAAKDRVTLGIAQIGVAVVYPAKLRSSVDVKSDLGQSRLDIAVVTESQEIGYTSGDVDYLKSALTLAFNHLVKEDVVADAVKTLDTGIQYFAESILTKPGVIGRLANWLELIEPAGAKEKQNFTVSTAHISGLVITNAMIFQETLSHHETRVPALHRLEHEPNLVGAFANVWKTIYQDIDYYPIFRVAFELLLELTAGQNLHAFRALIGAAQVIVRNKAALRHDLMGRVYHRLLADAKYLGTYYTSVPAATLLLRLALHAPNWKIDWSDLDTLQSFRVADLACGTGTLLMAATDAIANNYIDATVSADHDIELGKLHKILMESIIHGYDVLASAIHLTASTLAMRSPETIFDKMNLISLPLGGDSHSLGSIEFLRAAQFALPGFADVFGAVKQGKRVTGKGDEIVEVPRPQQLDLCVMNPPFTRSVGGNLLFGTSPDSERKAMQRELKKLLRTQNIKANITAGLGSIFVAIGHQYLKVGGRLALILPKALISGAAWGKTRELLRESYQVEMIIASQDPAQWNFSESTSLSEVLLIAQKVNQEPDKEATNESEHWVTAINLWRNPQTAFETLALIQAFQSQKPADIVNGTGTTSLKAGEQKLGEAVAFTWDELTQRESWMLPCAFAQTDLIRATYHLMQGKLKLPGYSQVSEINLVPLESLGTLGPDRRDIYDGFDPVDEKTAYAAFWGHDSKAVQTIAQQPNKYLSALSEPKKDRPSLRKPEQLWPLAGRLLFAERMRLNTQSVFAVRLARPVLSNVWWSFIFNNPMSEMAEKALVLWLNSTLGLLILLANRDETEGAWIDFKKPSLKTLPVLNVNQLTAAQLSFLSETYDQVCNATLSPFSDMGNDSVRVQIDTALAQALNLPDFTILRELLGQEPVVCLQQLG